ncbi:MAG: GreA/GreB family elongation factor [Burkholderiaceae bacterium]|nr:GreA/GreB family elongation factor [Burkholderiaceae bacterium]
MQTSSSFADSFRTLTELDHARLMRLAPGILPDALADALEQADLVDPREAPSDLVTMRSRVEIVDLDSGARQQLTLCYPAEAAPADGRISVLSPVGTGLLGLRAGAETSWTTPQGIRHRVRVEAVPFQPEASGDHLS